MRRIMLLCTLFLLSIAPVFAQADIYTTTTASRVRAEADTASAIVARLRAGTAVTVLDEVQGTKVGNSTIWYEVRLADGKEGYIHSSLVRKGAPIVTTSSVTTTNTNSTALTVQSTPIPNPPIPPASSNMCNGQNDLNCDDFANSADATAHLQQCGYDEDGLDRDKDGIACE